MLFATFTLAICATLLHAVRGYDHWAPAGPGDARSACPALNTLANHGLIPRNGKGLTVDMLTKVIVDVHNFEEDMARFFSNAGLSVSPDPSSGIFALDQVNKHGGIEHDSSLSRLDIHEGGDAVTFSWDAWSTVLKAFGNHDTVTIETAAYARRARLNIESHRDREFNLTGFEYFPFADAAVVLASMGDPITGEAKKAFVREWFEKERLPTALGWRKPSTPVSFDALVSLVNRMANVTGEDPGPVPFPTTSHN